MQVQPLREYAVWCPDCDFVSASPYASVRMQWYECPKCRKQTEQTDVQDCIVLEYEFTRYVDLLATEDNEILEQMLMEYTEGCIRIDGEML